MGHVKDRWFDRDKNPTPRHGVGRRWQVKYRVGGRERTGGSFAKKSDAEKHLIELESNLLRGQWVDFNDTTTTSEWMWLFADTLSSSSRTIERFKDTIRLHVDGTELGSTRLNKLRPSQARAWVADRRKVLGPAHLRTIVGRVKRALKAARADHLMADDPFVDIVLESTPKGRIVPLTPAQVAAIAETIGPRYRAMVIAQAGLGLRIGELLGLRKQDVDFMRRTVHIRVQVDEVTQELIDPKTPLSKRVIPLPDSVGTELSAHMQRIAPVSGGRYDGLIFHSSVGKPFLRQDYRTRTFKNAVRRAHETDPTIPPDTTPHDLRHHFASVLLAAGESVVAVGSLLGHENGRLVLETYGHLMPGREEIARRAIDAAFASVSGSEKLTTSQGRPK